MRGDRLEQTGGAQQFALCGRLAAGQNHAVDGIVEILGGTQQLPLGAELVEHRSVLCERALYGQDAGHAVLCRLGIGRRFLRNIFNSYNHDYSLAPDEGSRRMRWGGVG